MLAALLGVGLALGPGWYAGRVPAGRVWLVLRADGTSTYGGAAYGWRIEGDTLHLTGAQPLDLKVETRNGQPCLVGPPFQRVCLSPVPVAEPPPAPARRQPAQWVGRWKHAATGGRLVVVLEVDGRYRMIQDVVGDPEAETAGTWQGDEAGVVLEPAGGTPLRYRARRAGPDLLLGGGDLPLDVRFVAEK